MAAFATAAEFSTFTGRTLTVAETTTVVFLLDIVSAAIRGYTGQTISAVVDDTVTLDPPTGWLIFLPQVPVTGVTSVTVAEVPLLVTDYYWYGDTGVVRVVYPYRWGVVPRSVVVTYSHGYAAGSSELQLVKGICLQAAAALFSGQGESGGNVKSESIANYSVTYETAVETVAEVASGQLDRFRVLVIA